MQICKNKSKKCKKSTKIFLKKAKIQKCKKYKKSKKIDFCSFLNFVLFRIRFVFFPHTIFYKLPNYPLTPTEIYSRAFRPSNQYQCNCHWTCRSRQLQICNQVLKPHNVIFSIDSWSKTCGKKALTQNFFWLWHEFLKELRTSHVYNNTKRKLFYDGTLIIFLNVRPSLSPRPIRIGY